MKECSDNFRESAILDILQELKKKKIKIILYEPFVTTKYFENVAVIEDIKEFIKKSDLIIANRFSRELDSIKNKVYSRDLFNDN